MKFVVENVDDKYQRQRRKILQQRKLDKHYEIDSNGNIPETLLNKVRISRMTEMDLYFYSTEHSLGIINSYNEMLTFLYFKRVLKKMASTSPSDLPAIQAALHNNCTRYKKYCDQQRPNYKMTSAHIQDCDVQFLNWCKSSNIKFDKSISIMDYQVTGKGLSCSADLSPDTTVIDLPRSMIICTRTALESHIVYQQLKEAEVDDESLVTLFAMKEFCDPNSKWRGYFEAMPTSFETHPLFMSDNALDMLQGTLLFDEINNTKQSLKEFSSLMFPFIEQHFTQFFKGVLTIQNLTYIRCVMDTRAFQIDELGFCLLPMIDMCNTNPYPQLETRGYYRAESDSVQLNNMYQTCAGEQLYICYGPYSSRVTFEWVWLRNRK
ncbi:hypothetical protein AKO1_006474 [Acrasis kona]|uniref:SET domain-containing protein n=1 Tax=Acrasis kona TaxID=1008807 RepID=A0AAW2YIW5_9EUKA